MWLYLLSKLTCLDDLTSTKCLFLVAVTECRPPRGQIFCHSFCKVFCITKSIMGFWWRQKSCVNSTGTSLSKYIYAWDSALNTKCSMKMLILSLFICDFKTQSINLTSMKRFSCLVYGSFGWFGFIMFSANMFVNIRRWRCVCVCVCAQVWRSGSRWLAVFCASNHHRRCDIRYGSD